MAVQTIPLTASATDADPRSTPNVPQEKLVFLGDRIPQTDEQPCSLWLALEGTAGNTAVVSVYWSPNNFQSTLETARKWYLIKDAITVTVGAVVRVPAMPGNCCIRVTTAPAANATLLAVVSSQPYATPVS